MIVIDKMEKGSAEAATSPSRGSHNPAKEKAVNRQQATIAPASSARVPFDYEHRFRAMENPLADAVDRMNVLCVLAESVPGTPYRGDSCVIFMRHEVNALLHMIEDVRRAVHAIDEAWMGGKPESVLTNFHDLDEAAQLGTLIGEHRGAFHELEVAIVEGEKHGIGNYEESERYRHAEAEEKRAFERLLMWQPVTIEHNAKRLQYLFTDLDSPWVNERPSKEALKLLIDSMSVVA